MSFLRLVQQLILPSVFIPLIILFGLVLTFRKKNLKIGRIFIIIGLFSYYLFSITPFTDILLKPLEKEYSTIKIEEIKKADKVVLLLGGRESDVLRASEVLRIAHLTDHKSTVIISGTNPTNPGSEEALAVRDFFTSRGVPGENIIIEVSRVSKNNSALYLFGYWKILYKQIPILEKYGFIFKQSITIDKGIRSIGGRKTSTYTIFPNTTEHLIYFVKDNYPYVKTFLKSRQKQLKLKSYQINTKLGVKANGGGMWSIYTGKNVCKQLPSEYYWNKLQNILKFDIPYNDIKFTFNIEMGITDVWSDIDFYKDRKQRIHPTQKPYKLIERIIKASSNENDLVLDPFLGSGSTVNVCKKLNRYYYGMEKSKEYFDKINI